MKWMRIILVLVYVILIILLLLGLLCTCIGNYNQEDEETEVTRIGGTGDLKVTLQWDFYADVDLHVIEPSGEEIYFQHSSSRTGGELDVDNTEGGPGSAENIFWETPPHGQYIVALVYYAQKDGYPASQQQGNCTVTIMQKDRETRPYTKRLSPNNLSRAVSITTITVD